MVRSLQSDVTELNLVFWRRTCAKRRST